MPEHTIAENLTRLQNATTAIGNAITAKGGTVTSGDGLEDFASDIASIPSGGGGTSQPRKDVNFYDYDGTIVNSYTSAEFANLTAMPSNPSHDGLTAQGWNWSLSDAKTYVATYGKLEIGQMYVTDDGKTRLYITLTEGRTSPVLQLYLNANSELDIDWGDGSTHSTFTSTSAGYVNERHNYTNAGNYVIAITVVDGGFVLQSSSTYLSSILWNGNNSTSSPDSYYNYSVTRVEIGTGITQIGNYAFANFSNLTSITIPNSIVGGGQRSFTNTRIKCLTIPNSFSFIPNNWVYGCYYLEFVSIPNSVTSLQTGAFGYCQHLKSVTLPDTVTQIKEQSFYQCASLVTMTIPNSVTTIEINVFNATYALVSITIDKAEGSISGSPWNAITGSPTYTQIIWTGE